MKKFLSKYILYIYLNFIKDNYIDTYKKWAIPFVKIIIFIRAIYFWTFSVIFFPIFLIGMKIEGMSKNKKFKKMLSEIKNIYIN